MHRRKSFTGKWRGQLTAVAVALVFCGAGLVAATTEQEVAVSYKRAVAGDKQAVERCIALLERICAEEPHNELARAYLGSAYTLRSRDMSFGPAKLAMLRQGLSMLDAAVAAAPDDPQVRLVRARTTDALPFFLGRKQQSRDDFAWLAERARRSPGSFSAEDLSTIRAHTTR